MLQKNQEKIKQNMLLAGLILLWILGLWKSRFGFQCDEPYMIAGGDMIARGNAYIKDLSCLQMSTIFSAPIIWLHTKILGSTEGILLTTRIFSLLLQTLISICFYLTFAKEEFQKRYVLLASVLFFLFAPDFLNVLYKTELIWFALLEIIFTYRYYRSEKIRYLIFLAIMISASVLAYPTAIIEFPVYLLIIFKMRKERQPKVIRQWMILTVTCILCALLTVIFLFSRMSLQDFISNVPRCFQNDNLNSNFLGKLVHPLIKYIAMGCMVSLPIVIALKWEKARKILEKYRIPLITLLLTAAFLGQCYIERSGITWHCILYPYALTLFLIPILYLLGKKQERDKLILWLFELPAVTVVFCMALASNQGNMTSMYGSVFSMLGFVLLLGNTENTGKEQIFYRERTIIPIVLLLFALLMCIPVWDQETVMLEYPSGSVFTPRVHVTYGPAKGCKMGIPTYQEYDRLCSVIREEVTREDLLLLVDNERVTGYGYLSSPGNYATYHPQGGFSFGLNSRIVDYYRLNPNKQPTVVVINEDHIGQTIESYLQNTPLGQYLTENHFLLGRRNENYFIFRKSKITSSG